MSDWKVYVCNPPKSGKNGRNYMLSAQENGVEWRRRSARTPDHTLAEERAREWLAEIQRTVAPLSDDPTVEQILTRHMLWVDHDAEVEDSTKVTYRTALNRWLAVMGDVRASELDRQRVLDAVGAMRRGDGTPSGKPLKGTTLRLTLRRARDAWSWAQERGYVARPWPKLKQRDTRKWGRTQKRPYTDAEVLAVLAWIYTNRPAWFAFFSLMAATGMRSSEVCGLRGCDVRRDELEVRFRDAKSKEPTGAPVPSDVMDLLPKVAQEAPVFCGPKGGEATPHAANEVKLAAVRALNLPDAHLLDVHSFKRSWVDGLYRAGVDIGTAMRAARHVSQRVNEGYQRNALGHDVRAAQQKVLERREAALPLTPPPTQEAPNPLPGKALAGSASNRGAWFYVAQRGHLVATALHLPVARKCVESRGVAPGLGGGWNGIEHPHGAEIAEVLARHDEAMAALLFHGDGVEAARDWFRENRPHLVREAPAAREERARAR